METDTLIELYDERPLENVLGVEVFKPRVVIYICPQDIAADALVQKKLRNYFAHRGQKVELIFYKADIYNVRSVLDLLRMITERYGECAIDITGALCRERAPGVHLQPQKEPVLRHKKRPLRRRSPLYYRVQRGGHLPYGRRVHTPGTC